MMGFSESECFYYVVQRHSANTDIDKKNINSLFVVALSWKVIAQCNG